MSEKFLNSSELFIEIWGPADLKLETFGVSNETWLFEVRRENRMRTTLLDWKSKLAMSSEHKKHEVKQFLTLHVGILNKRIEEIGSLNEWETSVTQGRDRRVHTDSWRVNMGMC